MLNIVPAYLFGSLNEILDYFKGLRLSDAESDQRQHDMKTKLHEQ